MVKSTFGGLQRSLRCRSSTLPFPTLLADVVYFKVLLRSNCEESTIKTLPFVVDMSDYIGRPFPLTHGDSCWDLALIVG